MKVQCLAVIPARGGSKRIPDKNIKDLFGKPIISYTIDAARRSNLFSHIVVSTDSERIASIARTYGAEVPFLRDASLADDHTPVSIATLDALEKMDPTGNNFSYIAQLMPNCPMRNAQDIIDSYKQFLSTNTESQISVTHYGFLNPWWAMTRDNCNKLAPLFKNQLAQRSQDLPELYCPTGAVWWAKTSVLRCERTFHIADRTGWEIPWQRAIDIDTQDDWLMAESLMRMDLGDRNI